MRLRTSPKPLQTTARQGILKVFVTIREYREMIREQLLKILVCPETRLPLTPADAELMARVNQAIAAGQLKNRGGQIVRGPLDAGLVRQDGTILYPMIDGIPVMLVDEGIPLGQVS